MRELIVRAIAERRVLSIDYFPGHRLVEPHALGLGSKNQYLLRAFQTEGESASGEHEWWKLFRLDRCGPLSLTDIRFVGSRDGYRRGDKAMNHGIIAAL